MARKEKPQKEHTGVNKALLSAILITGFLCVIAAAYLWFYVLNQKPALVIAAQETEIEAGDTFDEWSMVKSLVHASREQVEIASAELDTKTPGRYEVMYTLGTESLPVYVNVVDTTPPRITLKEMPFRIKAGESVDVADLIESVSDNGAVTCTFEGGGTSLECKEEGPMTVKILAEDEAGNTAEAEAEIEVLSPDQEAPVIRGAENTAVELGGVFDVMDGVTVSDDYDPAPVLTADVKQVDTSVPGSTLIRYTASDASGKKTLIERMVTVADHVIDYEGYRYGVYWDLTGKEGQPYLVAVNRTMNTVTVYQQDAAGRYTMPVRAFVCSTGPTTPLGYFITLERERWRYLFEDCWGQYATRIEGHILFHSVPYFTQSVSDLEYEEYNLLGTSASLGCIRLTVGDVKWIYDNCPTGFPCVIYDDDVTAGPLGKPESLYIDPGDERRGWDPTDPDPANPWHT